MGLSFRVAFFTFIQRRICQKAKYVTSCCLLLQCCRVKNSPELTEKSSFKRTREKQQKSNSANAMTWNSLFIRVSKSEDLDPPWFFYAERYSSWSYGRKIEIKSVWYFGSWCTQHRSENGFSWNSNYWRDPKISWSGWRYALTGLTGSRKVWNWMCSKVIWMVHA